MKNCELSLQIKINDFFEENEISILDIKSYWLAYKDLYFTCNRNLTEALIKSPTSGFDIVEKSRNTGGRGNYNALLNAIVKSDQIKDFMIKFYSTLNKVGLSEFEFKKMFIQNDWMESIYETKNPFYLEDKIFEFWIEFEKPPNSEELKHDYADIKTTYKKSIKKQRKIYKDNFRSILQNPPDIEEIKDLYIRYLMKIEEKNTKYFFLQLNTVTILNLYFSRKITYEEVIRFFNMFPEGKRHKNIVKAIRNYD